MSHKPLLMAVTGWMMFCFCSSLGAEQPDLETKRRAQITQAKSWWLRRGHLFQSPHEGYGYIGYLTKRATKGNPALTLSTEQRQTLQQLDQLLYQANNEAVFRDADYVETNPPDYLEYLKRNKARRRQAVIHGQMLSLSSLLTVRQTNELVQRRAASGNLWMFHFFLIQGALELSEKQIEEIKQAREEYNHNTKMLFLNSRRPNAPDSSAEIRRHHETLRQAVMNLLTPAQHKVFDRISVTPTALEQAPETPLPSAEDRKRIPVQEMSDVFRAIAHLQNEHKLNLTAEQKQHLVLLYDITQRGLFWLEAEQKVPVSDRPENLSRLSRSEAAILKHAEQVALLAILSESQVKLVQSIL